MTLFPPVNVTSPLTKLPAVPPFTLVTVSVELYVTVESPLPSTP